MIQGLSAAEAQVRLAKYGPNEIEENRLKTSLENILKILSDPMGLMLLILSVIYWILGKHTDAIILLVAYIPIAGIDVLLEIKSQSSLRALKRTLRTTCFVIRDSKTVSIPTREIVPGDLLVLEEGQSIPADGSVIQATHLTLDESSLTGESIPIEKSEGEKILSGTTVLTGTGIVEIKDTGLSSQIGAIAKVLKEFESTPSPLLRTIQKAVKIVFIVAICLGITVFAVGMFKSEGFSTSLIAALTLAMASIPEEFPLVFTLYLSLAAYRLSKKGILVKSLPAVEGLARVNVICTDKTGTLTEGKFQLEKFHTTETSYEYISESLVFSCELKAVDAMEVSIFEFVTKNKGASFIADVHKDWVLEYDYQFNTHEKYMSHVWKNKGSGIQTIAMKGSIEGVLAHCKDFAEKQRFLEISKTEAEEGKRLLGLAGKVGKFTGHRTEDEKELNFLGILIFTDPVRPSVKAAVKTCVDQNIRIKMLTGDHLLTAHAIADRIGLPHEHDQLFTGPELEKMQSDSKKSAYQRGAIFARLKPEQKLELVQALKNEGDIVAMTGDGINDAPALKLADVGISMGENATDVARSTAQLVLLKNDFNGIVSSILEGERVLKSLADSFGYLVAFHIPIIGLVLIQSFFLNIPILYPIHIVLMELIVHPVSGFVFDENVFLGSQRQKTFLTKNRILASGLRGILLTATSLGIFFWTHGTVSDRQSLAVLTLVIGNAGLLLAEKGLSSLFVRARAFRAVTAVTLLLLLAFGLAYFPLLGRLFSITSPHPHEFIIALSAGLAIAFFPNCSS